MESMRFGYEQSIGFAMESMRFGYEKSSQSIGFAMESMRFGYEKSSQSIGFTFEELALAMRKQSNPLDLQWRTWDFVRMRNHLNPLDLHWKWDLAMRKQSNPLDLQWRTWDCVWEITWVHWRGAMRCHETIQLCAGKKGCMSCSASAHHEHMEGLHEHWLWMICWWVGIWHLDFMSTIKKNWNVIKKNGSWKIGFWEGGLFNRGWLTNWGGPTQFFIAGIFLGAGGYLIGGDLIILTLHKSAQIMII